MTSKMESKVPRLRKFTKTLTLMVTRKKQIHKIRAKDNQREVSDKQSLLSM